MRPSLRGRARAVLAATVALSVARGAGAQSTSTFSPGYLYGTLSSTQGNTALNYDFTVSTYQLLSTNLRFEEKNDKQKANFAPGKLRRDILTCNALCELTLNFVRTRDASTYGFGGAWNQTAPYTRRVDSLAKELGTRDQPLRLRSPGESDAAYAAYRQQYLRQLDASAEQYLRDLITDTWSLTYGANVQTFALLGGTKVDLDVDGKIDNAFAIKAWNVNAGVTYIPTAISSVVLTYHFTRERLSAVEGQALAPYHTVSLVAGRRLRILDPSYRSGEAYKRKAFVPALVGGIALELQRCIADADECRDRITRQFVTTGFIDVRVTPESQFRLGLPLKWVRVADKTTTEAQPIFQLGISLSGI